MESIPSYIKITKLDTDTIVEKVNVGSNWIPAMQGVRLTHLPTRTIVECTEHKSEHRNHCEARDALALHLHNIGYKSC